MTRATVPFGKFVELQPSVVLQKGERYPFIAMADVEPNVRDVRPGGQRIWKGGGNARFMNGDVIFARITPCLEHGKTARIVGIPQRGGFGSTEFFVFRARPGISESAYVYYLARSPQIRKPAIKSMIGASGRQRAQRTVIERIPVSQPSLSEQRSIASILSAYDDLIENNRRRVQLLERAARLLYREWFVNLRFPGHETVTIVDGVPEGWEKTTLGKVASLRYGKALKKADRVPGRHPVYGSSGVIGTHRKALVSGPGIIVGRKGNIGSVYWCSSDYHPIDTVYYIAAHRCSLYLYYSLLNTEFINTDVAVPGLNRRFACSRDVLSPDDQIRQLFEQQVQTIHHKMECLTQYNRKLIQARDLLLPRLMNGEIAV